MPIAAVAAVYILLFQDHYLRSRLRCWTVVVEQFLGLTAMAKKRPVKRLNLEMPPEVEKRLEDLQTRSGATSKAEVIRRALALYHMVLDVHESGGSITLREPDGAEERLAILL